MPLHVIYVTRSGRHIEHEHDPLLQLVEPYVCHDIGVPHVRTVPTVVDRICTLVERQHEDVPCVIVISAFLNSTVEGVQNDMTWAPDRSEITALLRPTGGSIADRPTLLSLHVMWTIWQRLRCRARILVTTDGVAFSRSYERLLEGAFSAGRACEIYNWNTDPEVLADIAAEVTEPSR